MIGKVLHKKKDLIIDGTIKKKYHGYYFVKCGLDYVPEHTLVVENHIKRTLNKGETVHHLDGNKLNNELNNLMLFKSQKDHASFHNKIRQFGLTNPIKLQIENRWKQK